MKAFNRQRRRVIANGEESQFEPVIKAREQAKEVLQEARPGIIGWARLGHLAKGAIYLVIGILTFQAAFGLSSPAVDQDDALQTIQFQPFGQILLGLVVLGLLGYAFWRVLLAVFDLEHAGSSLRGLAKRLGYILGGVGYTGIAMVAFQLLVGQNSTGTGDSAEHWTRLILALPFGDWLIGAGGAGFLIVSANLIYSALAGRFKKQLAHSDMNRIEKAWTFQSGRLGMMARATLLALVGVFLIRAAVTFNASEAGGLKDVLLMLARQPFGAWLLSALACGLISYGVYSIALARFGRYDL